ncbi:MAG TPA: response regulator [Fimbriimonadaceae bacterium]|jgi:two-component system response regulator
MIEEPKTILLVEDNADDEKLTLRAMRQSEIPNIVVVARDGAEALQYILGHSTNPSRMPALILLDLKLPKVSGLEVLEKLRSDARTQTLPVVVLSSSDEQRDIEQSYLLGANSYIRKPVDFEEFIDSVRQLGQYWLTINLPSQRLATA